ncbi:sodium/potassium-transporting ATPase subunit beta-3 isoform X2 [Oncorhynchus mykiss]|uniref:sodium/potassium-transporting ATPase subunit beta-3 isoform X2 n=1 Tax=Oncorhynchus mykiss TaxID=8022 RepID=UPI0018778D1A|nr:sodium/potassium-transporting ATPase subunit beta-3 isoform X2 [Oncorhynchus mykiss]
MASNEDKPAAKEDENAGSWKDSIFNPRTGEFCGRTAKSWGLILLFYLVFYAFLAGMFVLTIWVMLLTLDDYVPKYRDRVPHPGLVIRPKQLDMLFNRSQPLQFAQYVQTLESFLQHYNDTEQERNVACAAGGYFEQEGEVGEQRKVCQFKRSDLSLCSGLSDSTFGYTEGRPCVLLKMNRIIGLKPRGDPYVNCTAKERYVQPLVAVKLLLNKDDYNTELTIECRIEGSDLRNNDDRDKFLGRVTFRITVKE